MQALNDGFYTSDFGVRNVEIVGPQVGKQLQTQAKLAILYSLAGMLVYLWFRFELIYGVAAVVACFHDTLITVGAFSLLNKEISLTVIAAILTLVGYSMNDTIVVFDRIRENVKLLRRESLAEIVNRSINQTLSRTVLTSGLTFLTVLSLYLFGGEVLHGFTLALVIGIIIGTYSSIFIASPMLVAYQDWRLRRSRGAAAALRPRARNGARRFAPRVLAFQGFGIGVALVAARRLPAGSARSSRLRHEWHACVREQNSRARCLNICGKNRTGEQAMFEDSLIESGGRLRSKRGATTVLSFVLQAILLGILILIPLIYTEALPKQQLMTFLVAPPPPPPPPPPAGCHAG